MLKGSIVALITPFDNGNLSEDGYIKLINYHLEKDTSISYIHIQANC